MTHPLLNIESLSVTFGHGSRAFKAVDQVSLQVNEGEVLAVVGESGSGKSVTMMALMGLIDAPGIVSAPPPVNGTTTAGRCR